MLSIQQEELMMLRKYRLRSMLVAVLLSYWTGGGGEEVMAQQKPPAGEKQVGAEVKPNDALSDGTFRLLWSKLNVDSEGSDRSPTRRLQLWSTQTLSDGNQIIRKASAYYRDGEGRIRTEQKLDSLAIGQRLEMRLS
jgi:hypothetical protein